MNEYKKLILKEIIFFCFCLCFYSRCQRQDHKGPHNVVVRDLSSDLGLLSGRPHRLCRPHPQAHQARTAGNMCCCFFDYITILVIIIVIIIIFFIFFFSYYYFFLLLLFTCDPEYVFLLEALLEGYKCVAH